ncbi:MAG: IPT/TIG domain-containing protein, partial [Planctomycetota bacterium]
VPSSADGIPDVYRGNGIDGFGGVYFEANEMCFGCHGDDVDPYTGDSLAVPTMTAVSPKAVCPTGVITITGNNFGDLREDGEDYVEFRNTAGGVWTQPVLPSYLEWGNSQIIVEVPAWDFAPGNYKVRVTNETGTSAASGVFTLYDCISPQEIWVGSSPLALGPDPYFNTGQCTNTISLQNPSSTTFGFGSTQDQVAKDIYGVVQFSASQGDYLAKNYITWTNSEIKFKFKNFFEDLDGDYIQDANEPDILMCSDLALGTYSVYVKYIFYIDGDANNYDDGDTITQIETSNPVTFELTNDPYINQLNPKNVERNRRFRIFGINFGPTQTDGEVHVGSQKQYNTDPFGKGKVQPASRIKLWSNTKIAVRLRVPPAWAGKARRVWVVKDGVASNHRKLNILP